MKRKVEEIVYEISRPIIDEYGFELVDIEFKKEGSEWYLRIYIDKQGGITIDDCQTISEKISDLLDETDPISHSYIFEVSSPGIERPLKTDRDFMKNIEKEIEVSFYKPYEGKKNIKGILKGYNDTEISVEINSSITVFERKLISLIKPVVNI